MKNMKSTKGEGGGRKSPEQGEALRLRGQTAETPRGTPWPSCTVQGACPLPLIMLIASRLCVPESYIKNGYPNNSLPLGEVRQVGESVSPSPPHVLHALYGESPCVEWHRRVRELFHLSVLAAEHSGVVRR